MHSNFVMAVYSTGEAVKLTLAERLPGAEVIAFIHCVYDAPTPSGKNHYYSYSLFDKNFEQINSNCLEWNGFKCLIAKKDSWLPPFPSWGSNYEMRVKVTIEKSDGDIEIINLVHTKYYGDAFVKLFKILKAADEKGNLADAVRIFKKEI
ncbi:hypothetical protein SAMN06265337_4213 [Hymenobacter gelipurpurascens]|uniref:Uncharacterized protein n=1 Tax=Hymenobacter gelipurpurascens TaxID=89968 RepID=A0A212UH85_9BACT|nr:hypothetical protein [Hymenobacter gelipurpurascens]SNC77617.1 hypothetical protein SAMN06265337_4213 [Hymenobacter gelipurpurascens]